MTSFISAGKELIMHLASVATIHKNAGKKAAQTRKQKAKEKSATLQYSCGICHDVYKEYTLKVENWICCDGCDTWYHFVCVYPCYNDRRIIDN